MHKLKLEKGDTCDSSRVESCFHAPGFNFIHRLENDYYAGKPLRSCCCIGNCL